MKPTYKPGYKSKPSLYGINDIDPMAITTPPEFLENETRQAMLNLNVSPNDLVINSNSNLDDHDAALLEQKRIRTFNKVVEERNRLFNITYNQQPKRKKKSTKKDNLESNDSNEQSPRKHHKNPRFKDMHQNDQESNEGDTSDDVIREPKKVLKPKKTVQQPKEPKNNAQQKNAIQQPQGPKPKKSPRQANKQNPNTYYDQQNTNNYDDFSLNPSQMDYLDQDDLEIPKSNENEATEFLYPDEIERKRKNEELVRKNNEYKRLKQKKFNDFMKEQERRKRTLYRPPPKVNRKYKTSLDDPVENSVSCSTAIDMFTKKKQEQHDKELKEEINLLPSKEPRVRQQRLEAQEQIQKQEKLQQELEEIRQREELLQKQKQEMQEEQKQMRPAEPNDAVAKKKRRRRVKKKVHRKRRHHKNANNNDDEDEQQNENPKNLIEATKGHPKVVKPNLNNTIPKKKWSGKSKIPRYSGSQEIYDDFYS